MMILEIRADFKRFGRWLREFIRKPKEDQSEKKPQSVTDPLDISVKTGEIFITCAALLYQHIEKGSAENIYKGLNRFFMFLFKKVEKFTSDNLWAGALEGVVKSSRNIQRMHPGLLRFNLLWLFLFIGILVVIVWINFNGVWI